jgi:hypothetical protein
MVDKTKPRTAPSKAMATQDVPKAPKQEILPRENAGSAVEALPDFMKGDANLGKENITRDMMEVPRLKLMQSNSPEVEADDSLRPGHFLYTTNQESLGESFVGTVLYVEETFILWNPRDAGGGILARADDGVHWSPPDTEFKVTLDKKDGGGEVIWRTANTVKESGLAEWGSFNPKDPKSSPAATRMLNFLIAFPEQPDLFPAVLTFQRTSIKYGKQLVGRLRTFNGPIFGAKYRFSSDTAKNAKGQPFKIMKAQGVGLVTDPALYDFYKQTHLAVKRDGLNIKDVDSLQAEAESERGVDGESDNPDAPKY